MARIETVCESLVVDLSMGQRLAIKLCFKGSYSATETLQMVNEAYGDEALSPSNVFRWYERFRDGPKDTEYDPRSEDHVGDFLRLARRNPQRICSGG